MNNIRRLLTSAFIAVSALVLPLSAMAEAGKVKGASDGFPMKTEAYQKQIDAKIAQMKEHFEKGLAQNSFAPDHKAELKKSGEAAVKELQEAVHKAGADGTVSREEAKEIRELGQKLRSKLRSDLKGKHAKVTAKGQKPAKGKALSKSKKALSKTKKALSKGKSNVKKFDLPKAKPAKAAKVAKDKAAKDKDADDKDSK